MIVPPEGYLPNVNNYIGPGTISLIIQILIAGLIGGLFLIKVYWKKISSFFSNLFSRTRHDNDND